MSGDDKTPIPGEGGPQDSALASPEQNPVPAEPLRPVERGIPGEEMRVVQGTEGPKSETMRFLLEDAHRGEPPAENPKG